MNGVQIMKGITECSKQFVCAVHQLLKHHDRILTAFCTVVRAGMARLVLRHRVVQC